MDVKYVDEYSMAKALEWESRFQRLPREAGIFFVSAAPQPALMGISTEFTLVLGIAREITEDAALGILRNFVLVNELKDPKLTITVHIYRGSPGVARDIGSKEAHRNTVS